MIATNYEVILYIVFKMIIALIGALCFYLGYKLFLKGIEKSAGELEASNTIGKIKLLKAAPGTFLFIVGGVIICYLLLTSSLISKRNGPLALDGANLIQVHEDTLFKSYDSIKK